MSDKEYADYNDQQIRNAFGVRTAQALHESAYATYCCTSCGYTAYELNFEIAPVPQHPMGYERRCPHCDLRALPVHDLLLAFIARWRETTHDIPH